MISTIKPMTQPKQVAIPLHTTRKADIKVDINDTVSIGTPLLYKRENAVYSTVSGKVIKFTRNRDLNNNLTTHVIIENNHKNHVYTPIKKLTDKQRIERYFIPLTALESYRAVPGEPLLVNLVYINEPFIALDPKITEDILDQVITALNQLHALYPISRCRILCQYDHPMPDPSEFTMPVDIIEIHPEKEVDYLHRAINTVFNEALVKTKPYQFLSTESLLHLHEIFTFQRPPVLTRLVLSGGGITHPMVFNVRIGTLFENIRRAASGYTTHAPCTMTHNSLFANQSLNHDTFTLTRDTISIHIEEHREREVYDCIACGRCNNHCPVGILPSKIMHAVEDNIILDRMHSDMCIECGLCSYYCPSKIDVMGFVKEAKFIRGGRKK